LALLLAGGADPNVQGENDADLPLATACEQGRIDMVTALLKAGADPNAGPNNQEPLALDCALRGGHTDVVKLLIKAGAKPQRLSGYPLASAAGRGHLDALQVVLRAAPKLNEVFENKGQRDAPMGVAVSQRDLRAIAVLLKLGLYSRSRLKDALKLAEENRDQELAAKIRQTMQ
jgi:ankyrin repeat protein